MKKEHDAAWKGAVTAAASASTGNSGSDTLSPPTKSVYSHKAYRTVHAES